MAPHGYRELRTNQARVELAGMAYFVLSGRDHREWLQGQATNDVRQLEHTPWLDFCLTKPSGQLTAVCRAWTSGANTIIATQQPEVLEERAKDTVFIEDVALSRAKEDYVCVQGIEAKRVEGSLFSDRIGSGGVERVPGAHHLPEAISRDAYLLATLEAGIPLFGTDTSDKTLPPELGPHFESIHVSYTKGCYTGQEVLMRMHSRGHTNKTWVGLKTSAPIIPGARVNYEGKDVGTVHRAALSPAFGHIASATLRNEATAEGTKVQAGDTVAEVVTMPFLRQTLP
jgi:folate-binding protein YgfZ